MPIPPRVKWSKSTTSIKIKLRAQDQFLKWYDLQESICKWIEPVTHTFSFFLFFKWIPDTSTILFWFGKSNHFIHSFTSTTDYYNTQTGDIPVIRTFVLFVKGFFQSHLNNFFLQDK